MRRQRRRLFYAALLAGILHVDVAVLVAVIVRHTSPSRVLEASQEPVQETIGIQTLDDETTRKIVADLDRMQEEEERAEEAKKEEKEPIQAPGQVVDLPPPPEPSPRPRESRYVAEHDSSVAKETKHAGEVAERAPSPPGLLAMREPTPPAAPSSAGGRMAQQRPAPSAPSAPSPPQRDPAEARPPDEEGAFTAAPPPAAAEQPPADSGEPGPPGPPLAPALTPTANQLSQALGSGTQDYLPDIDDGDATALNARSWKFASFFNRVKRQVAEHWKPGREYGKRDPTGQIYGNGHWVTFLRIVLKRDGTLESVLVQQPSGLEFLDDVAVEAVKRGQPYPNPPPQLIDPNSGNIQFKFGFFFDVGSTPRMRVFRYSGL